MATADLVIAFDARIGNLESALKRTDTALKSTERQAKETGGALATSLDGGARGATTALSAITRGLGLFTAALAAVGVSSGISAALQSISQLADLSGQLNVTTGELQALRDAFREAGASPESASQALAKLNDLIGDAARGTAASVNVFADLGVAFKNTDGSIRDTSAVLQDFIDRISSAESEAEKFSIATQLVGARAARGLVAAISEMNGSIEGHIQKLREMGIAVSEDVPKDIDALGTAFNRLGDIISGSLATAIASVRPELEAFFTWLGARIAEAAGGIASLIQRDRLRADPQYQELSNANAQAQSRLTALQRQARALEAERPAQSILDGLTGARSQEAIDRDLIAVRQRYTEAEAAATAARTAFDEFTRVRQENANLPTPPTFVPEPAAPPARIDTGGASQRVDEMARAAQRLFDATRTPLEQFRISSETALGVWNSGKVTAALGGFDTISRAVSEYAVTSYNGLTQAGATSEQAQAKVLAALEGMRAGLQVGSEAWTRWGEVVRRAQEEVARSAQVTQTELDRVSGAAAKQVDSAFSNIISSIALEGATLEQAWDKLLKSILKTVIDFVYQMTVQAAILRLLKAADRKSVV